MKTDDIEKAIATAKKARNKNLGETMDSEVAPAPSKNGECAPPVQTHQISYGNGKLNGGTELVETDYFSGPFVENNDDL